MSVIHHPPSAEITANEGSDETREGGLATRGIGKGGSRDARSSRRGTKRTSSRWANQQGAWGSVRCNARSPSMPDEAKVKSPSCGCRETHEASGPPEEERLTCVAECAEVVRHAVEDGLGEGKPESGRFRHHNRPRRQGTGIRSHPPQSDVGVTAHAQEPARTKEARATRAAQEQPTLGRTRPRTGGRRHGVYVAASFSWRWPNPWHTQ